MDAHGFNGWSGTLQIPPRKIDENIICNLLYFPAHGKIVLKWPQMGPGGFFPTNPDLADILGRTDLNFENFRFWDVLDPKFQDFQVPRSPNSQISRSPDLQIPRFTDFQVPRFPDAGAAAAGRALRSQPDPSPNAPRDQIRRKGPCCDEPLLAKHVCISDLRLHPPPPPTPTCTRPLTQICCKLLEIESF